MSEHDAVKEDLQKLSKQYSPLSPRGQMVLQTVENLQAIMARDAIALEEADKENKKLRQTINDLRQKRDRDQRRIAELEQQARWIPVGDMPFNYYGRVLCKYDNGYVDIHMSTSARSFKSIVAFKYLDDSPPPPSEQ